MDDRNKELEPGYNKTTKSSVKGIRLFNTTSLLVVMQNHGLRIIWDGFFAQNLKYALEVK